MIVLDTPIPCEWWLEEPSVYGEAVIRLCPQISGPHLYKVKKRSWCLSKTGEWDYEPIPSERDDEYLEGHRFATFEDALAAVRAARPLL